METEVQDAGTWRLSLDWKAEPQGPWSVGEVLMQIYAGRLDAADVQVRFVRADDVKAVTSEVDWSPRFLAQGGNRA